MKKYTFEVSITCEASITAEDLDSAADKVWDWAQLLTAVADQSHWGVNADNGHVDDVILLSSEDANDE